MTAQIHNFYDSASGRITDPVGFLAADGDVKAQVLRLWAADHGGSPRPSRTRSTRSCRTPRSATPS
jgi:hypothetical protein